jgi:hypothetical protein
MRAAALLLTVLASLGIVLVPAFLIQPFAPQTPADLTLAYRLRAWSPWATPVLLAAGLLLIAGLWTGRGRPARLALGLAGLLLGASAFLARQNHFGWMFRPLPQPRFVEAAQATHLEAADLVLGVAAGGQAKAYPVRMMAYHHVLNDLVGGEPVVVTY